MPDVGVLELQIRDNADQAGGGLKNLADALVRVRTSVGNDKLGLSKVGTELNSLARQINGTKSNTPTVVKNITALMNSLTGFSKIKNLTINTDSIEKLKNIIGSGLNIGNTGTQMQALKNALGGEWDATKATSGMQSIVEAANSFSSNDTAMKIQAVTKEIKNFTKAYKDLPKNTSKLKDIIESISSNVFSPVSSGSAISKQAKATKQQIDDVVDYMNVSEEWYDMMNQKLTFKEPLSNIGDSHKSLIPINLQQFGGKKKRNMSGELSTALEGISEPAVTGLENVQSAIQMNTESTEVFKNSLLGVREVVASIVSATKEASAAFAEFLSDPLTAIMERYKMANDPQTSKIRILDAPVHQKSELELYVEQVRELNALWSEFAYNFNAFKKEGMRLAAGDPVLRLTDGGMTRKELNDFDYRNFMEESADRIWGAYKEGAIPVEGTVSDAADSVAQHYESMAIIVRDSMEEVRNQLFTVPVYSSLEEAAERMGLSIEEVMARVVNLKDLEGEATTMPVFSSIEEAARHMGVSVEEAERMVHELEERLHLVPEKVEEVKTSLTDLRSPEPIIPVESFIETYSHIDYLRGKLNEMKNYLQHGMQFGLLGADDIDKTIMKIRSVENEIRKLEDAEEEAKGENRSFSESFKDFRKNLSNAFPTISMLIKRFKSMAIMRSLRYIIRSISAGFREGVQNVYEYSKAIGSSFAPDMDSAATALQQMKNSIGAAAAPMIQSLIPVLQSVVNWFIEIVNWANQFISLLRGQSTWTRAVPAATNAFGKQEKAAKKAGNAIKDLLADWDELNIIQSNTSGADSGLGTSNAEDYLKMFEEVGEFDNQIKETVGWIQEHMDVIKATAEAIGVAILAWKLSKVFTGSMDMLHGLILGGVALKVGFDLTWEGAFNAGLNGGFDTSSMLETAGGILLDAVGGALIGFQVAGPWGAVTGAAIGLIAGIAVAVAAYYDGERTKQLQAKWGKITLTEEDVKELVENQVTAKVALAMEITDASVANRAKAKLKADMEIMKFSTALTTAKFMMEAKKDPASINTALETAKSAISAIQASLDQEREGLKLSFTKFKYKDKNGNDVTSELYSQLLEGNMAIDDFFTDLGNDIAKFISKGFSEGLTEQEQLMAMDLMETLNSVTAQAERNYTQKKIIRDAEKEMSGLYDMETAQAIFDRQKQRLADYQNTVTAQFQEDLEGNYKSLEYFKAIQEYYKGKNNNEKVAEYEKYIQAAQTAIENLEDKLSKIQSGEYQWNLDEEYNGMVTRMADLWKEKFGQWYKDSFIKSLYDDNVESPYENNPLSNQIFGFYGFSPELLLTEEELSAYYNHLIEKYNGDVESAIKELESKGLTTNQAMLSKYFPESLETPNEDVSKAINEVLTNMILEGIEPGSDEWKVEIGQLKRGYNNSELVDAVAESIIEEFNANNKINEDVADAVSGNFSLSDFVPKVEIDELLNRNAPISETDQSKFYSARASELVWEVLDRIAQGSRVDTAIFGARANTGASWSEYTEVRDIIDQITKDYNEMMEKNGQVDPEVLYQKYAPLVPSPNGKVEIDETSMTNSVAKGVNGATVNVTGIDTLASLLRLILARGGTGSTGVPTDSNTGFNIARAMGAAGMVTGDIP